VEFSTTKNAVEARGCLTTELTLSNILLRVFHGGFPAPNAPSSGCYLRSAGVLSVQCQT
jgi:hypothetical protein